MKITKYKHACLLITKDNQSVVIDPGVFSTDFVAPDGIVAVIITHEHGDHLNIEHIKTILQKNPDATVFGHSDVMAHLLDLKTTSVTSNETVSAGTFKLSFFGGKHAQIHSSIPQVANLGVLIDDLVYYPGDSFTVPNVEVTALALPISAPWLNMSEAIDFLLAVHPRIAIPTHDDLLSDNGKQVADRLLTGIADANHITYYRPTEPIIVKDKKVTRSLG